MVKNIDFDEWITQIEKVVLLTGKLEYISFSQIIKHPIQMISQCPNETPWDDLKCKLQEVYSMVAMEYHAATDLLRKQRPSESLQDYIVYWMEMCYCIMKIDPSMINNKLVIVLFIKNMYNKYEQMFLILFDFMKVSYFSQKQNNNFAKRQAFTRFLSWLLLV